MFIVFLDFLHCTVSENENDVFIIIIITAICIAQNRLMHCIHGMCLYICGLYLHLFDQV